MNSMAPTTFLRKASDIASFYGFRPVRDLEGMVPRESRMKRAGASRSFEDVAHICVSCMVETTRTPVLCFSVDHAPSDAPKAERDLAGFNLQLIGSPSSVGDIVVLSTLMTILAEAGAPARAVRVNAFGDKDSQARFAKELALFVRKRAADIPEDVRHEGMKDPFSLMRLPREEVTRVMADAPRPLSFLSERSRAHLKEVLENLERLNVPFSVDDTLLADERAPRLHFSVEVEGDHPLIAGVRGGRYDDYLRKVTGKKEGMGVRASIFFRKRGVRGTLPLPDIRRKAKVYFVQLGTQAKLKSLLVLEVLRQARIPVYQSFDADRLAHQLAEAEQLKVPYLLIMGHKEALESSVIIRTVANRSQEVVPVHLLPRVLGKLV